MQQVVHITDFTSDDRRKLAERYWQHQRDEGEPVFNEFMGTLDTGDLTQLAIELVEEFETLQDADARLKEAIEHLASLRSREEDRKLLAELRRTNDSPAGTTPAEIADDPLRKLMEKARQPDLRRVGG